MLDGPGSGLYLSAGPSGLNFFPNRVIIDFGLTFDFRKFEI